MYIKANKNIITAVIVLGLLWIGIYLNYVDKAHVAFVLSSVACINTALIFDKQNKK